MIRRVYGRGTGQLSSHARRATFSYFRVSMEAVWQRLRWSTLRRMSAAKDSLSCHYILTGYVYAVVIFFFLLLFFFAYLCKIFIYMLLLLCCNICASAGRLVVHCNWSYCRVTCMQHPSSTTVVDCSINPCTVHLNFCNILIIIINHLY